MFLYRAYKILFCIALLTASFASVAFADSGYQPYYYDRDSVQFSRPSLPSPQTPSAIDRSSQFSGTQNLNVSSVQPQIDLSPNSYKAADERRDRLLLGKPAVIVKQEQRPAYNQPDTEMAEGVDLGAGFGW